MQAFFGLKVFCLFMEQASSQSLQPVHRSVSTDKNFRILPVHQPLYKLCAEFGVWNTATELSGAVIEKALGRHNVSPAIKAPVITYTYTVYEKKYPAKFLCFIILKRVV
jgi:hypothetical protein